MKKLLLIIIILTATAAGVFYYTFISVDYRELNFLQKEITASINDKFTEEIERLAPERRALADYDSLMNSLNWYQKLFANRIFSINPNELGFKGPFYSTEKPKNLVKVESVKLGGDESARETGIVYCPPESYKDYLAMMKSMEEQIGKRLYIDSGYRSPGRQAYLVFYYLATSSNFSLIENARWIAWPGFSEHGHPVNNAIDFTSTEGINGFSNGQTSEDFTRLPEYEWLKENAGRFNFYLSYPEGNPHGVAFEPWHWHWEIK